MHYAVPTILQGAGICTDFSRTHTAGRHLQPSGVIVQGMAQRMLYVETPCGFLEQPAAGGNLHQRHWSGWFPHDFESRGYTVFGMGVRGLKGVQGGSRLLPEPMVRGLERGLAWLTFRRPSLAFCVAAIRYVDEHGVLRMV